VKITVEVIVMVFWSTYQNAKVLTVAGLRVINMSWQPLYIVLSRPKYRYTNGNIRNGSMRMPRMTMMQLLLRKRNLYWGRNLLMGREELSTGWRCGRK
jgi:hypothetical protein